MSSSTDPSTVVSAGTAMRSAASRWQFWIVLLVIGSVVALLIQLLDTSDTEIYGTENTDLDGYAAVANVLDDHGVNLHRVYSAEAARELLEQEQAASLVVLLREFPPDERFAAELDAEWDAGREVLWISDDPWLLTEVFAAETQTGARIPVGAAGTPEVLESGPRCALPAAEAARSLQAPGVSLRTDSGCFPIGEDGYVLAETSRGVVFTAPEAFTNQHITAEGNAALALGLLGAKEGNDAAPQDLIWYTPSGADSVGDQQWGSPLDYLPEWLWPLVWWLIICAGIGMVAAGRRYGPVVSEPLPVNVPAEEAAVGRGRLYQRANAVPATLQVLRSAHLLRLTKLLRLGRGAAPETVAVAAAHVAGWETSAVRQLLERPGPDGAAPPHAPAMSHRDMVTHAQALAKLESDVRQALRTRRRTE
ncbi:DUF4350 domain-containing protein [Nesterenkonia natronophila]|uniref:DUF4350 domain-containing protein n=1 Tax=Nesterenkonia natronophila TaxID=2174932 RepID=A0A3A4F274_9MICC|nr:DUF4350 domain-containing protein [Nesterenkonia natronophila]RJN31811.1 hypothetical protein D3250_06730 [Nesterenkonia natronophila]